MWTLASVFSLQHLPDLDHPATQQKTAGWLMGMAHLGQVRKGLPEPETFLLGPGGAWQSQPRKGRGWCLRRNEKVSES